MRVIKNFSIKKIQYFTILLFLFTTKLMFSQSWIHYTQLPNGDKPKKIIANSEYIFCFVENGLYLSDMKSGNWTLMNNNVPAPNAIEYFDTNLYIGLDNGLYISKNNGNSLEKLNNGLPSFKVWDIFCTKTEVYVSFGGHIYKTNDNGITWKKITEFKNGRAYAIAVSNDVMIAGFDGNKVLFSYDNGTTWEEPITKIPGAGPAVENITITDSVIHVSHLGDYIWYTTDFGRNWYKISSSFNIFLKQGKEYIIWQNNSNHNLCTFPRV